MTSIVKRSRGLTLACVFCCSLAMLCAHRVWGLNYSPDDLMIGFRQPTGTEELVVDLGPATNVWALAPGSTITVTNFSHATLNAAFSDLSEVKWSAFAALAPVYDSLTNQPSSTYWATRARTNLSVMSVPWTRHSAIGQGQAASRIDTVGANANTYSTLVPQDPVKNTATSVVIPAGNPYSYSVQVGPNGDFKGTVGVVENTTPTDFVTSQKIVRSDLFEMQPTPPTGPGVFRGYLEFRWDGTMTFTAALSVSPTLLSLSPASGDLSGGARVTISGSGFADGLSVWFGGVPAPSVNFSNSTLASVIIPPHSAGAVDVMVVNPDGQTSALKSGFTYTSGQVTQPLTIGSVSLVGSELSLVTSGATNQTVWVLTSTNALTPLASWVPIATNAVGADGFFTNAFIVDPSEAYRFFSLVIP